jgi:hypothetical protein
MSRFFIKKGNAALVSAFAIVALVAGGTFYLYNQSNQSAKASGVTPTITPQVAAVSTAGTITYSYATTATLPIGSQIMLTYPNAYAGTLSTANTTVNTVAPSTLTNSVGATKTTSTITLANSITSGNTVTISTSALTTPVSAGNYAITFTSSVGDLGGNFQYVGSANIVNVTASVPVSLSFVIRNSGDTANTNVCDLGTADTAAISTCSYRLKVGTNAKNGYLISFLTSGALTDGSYNMADAAVGAAGTAIAAGTETYGVNITAGSITGAGGTMTLATPYSTSVSNVVRYNTVSNTTILTANKPNNPGATGDTTNTSLVTHKLAISSNTNAGNFTQNVTYFVSPSF